MLSQSKTVAFGNSIEVRSQDGSLSLRCTTPNFSLPPQIKGTLVQYVVKNDGVTREKGGCLIPKVFWGEFQLFSDTT